MNVPRSSLLKQLISGSRCISVPFALKLRSGTGVATLKAQSIRRLLPGKRLVVKATWKNRTVIAKLFVTQQRGKLHAQKEVQGHDLVQQIGLASPQLVLATQTVDDQLQCILYEHLEHNTDFADICQSDIESELQMNMYRQLLDITLQLHSHGAFQEDLHLNNFLQCNQTLYLIDLGSITIKNNGQPLDLKTSLRNLAMLTAQLPVWKHETFLQLILSSSLLRNQNPESLRDLFQQQLRYVWRKRNKEVANKCLRDSTPYYFEQHFSRLVVCKRDWLNKEVHQLLANPDSFMQQGRQLKNGNSSTVSKAFVNGKQVVIKRYNMKSFRHFITRCARKTRARHSWLSAHLLNMAGIPAVFPLALIEERFGILKKHSYFICEHLDGEDLLQCCSSQPPSGPLLRQINTLFQRMIHCGITHGDFKATNFIVCNGRPHLIDLDSVHQHFNTTLFRKAFEKDLTRFLNNWSPQTNFYTLMNQLKKTISQDACKL